MGRRAVWVIAALSSTAPILRGQSIFSEPPPNRAAGSGAGPVANTGGGYRPPVASEQPNIVTDDASYLFPPVPWEQATRGVVGLTTAPGAGTRPAGVPPASVPQPDARTVEALQRRYAPLVGEKNAKDYDEVYGPEERRAAGKPEAMLALCQSLRSAARELGNQPEMRRYVLLRAFSLGRAGGAPAATMDEIARELDPALEGATPALMAQRAELWAAMAEGAGPTSGAVRAAARACYDLALWQLNHNYLEQSSDSFDRADWYARLGAVQDVIDACGLLRAALRERAAARATYVKLAAAVAERPDDPKVNGELAMFLLTSMRDVTSAARPAGRSDDPELKALAAAWEAREPKARAGGVGLALAALVDRSEGKDKAALAALALGQLDAFLAKASPVDRDYTKARLYATRLRPLAAEGAPGGVVVVPPPPAREGGRANVGGGQIGGAGGSTPVVARPVLVEVTGKRVVYVLDSSGSMMNKFGTLRDQMRRAVDSLQAGQQFDIVFFSEDNYRALAKGPMPITPESRKLAYDFLDKSSPHGSSDPIVALRTAFGMNPDTIYLLTDGDFPNNNQVVREIRRLNTGRRVRINTVAYMDRGEAYEKLLRQISDETGGTFRFVSQTDPVQAR